jgi:hypothetical protein
MTNSIWTKAYWQATAERVISTAAQAGLLAIGADQFNVLELDWANFGGFVGGGAVLSLLKSLVANAATKTGPGLTNSEQVVPPESPEAAAAQAGRASVRTVDLDGDGRDDNTGRFV